MIVIRYYFLLLKGELYHFVLGFFRFGYFLNMLLKCRLDNMLLDQARHLLGLYFFLHYLRMVVYLFLLVLNQFEVSILLDLYHELNLGFCLVDVLIYRQMPFFFFLVLYYLIILGFDFFFVMKIMFYVNYLFIYL